MFFSNDLKISRELVDVELGIFIYCITLRVETKEK